MCHFLIVSKCMWFCLSCTFVPKCAGVTIIQNLWVYPAHVDAYFYACLFVCVFAGKCVCVLALWRGLACVTAGAAPPGSKQYWQTHQSWWCIGLPARSPPASPSHPQRRCGAVLTCCHLGNCCQRERPAGIADPSWRPAGELQQEMSSADPWGPTDPCLCPRPSIRLLLRAVTTRDARWARTGHTHTHTHTHTQKKRKSNMQAQIDIHIHTCTCNTHRQLSQQAKTDSDVIVFRWSQA